MDYVLFGGCINGTDSCDLKLKNLGRFTSFKGFIKSLDGLAHIAAGTGVAKVGLSGCFDALFSRFNYRHEALLYRVVTPLSKVRFRN